MKLGLGLGLNGIGLSSVSAAIIYDGTMFTDSSMLRFLENKGSSGSTYNATANASNLIYLDSATQSVLFPLDVTLGSEILTATGWGIINGGEITTFTSVSGTAFNLAVTTAGTNTTRPRVYGSTDLSAGVGYKLSFNATVNSGTPILTAVGTQTTLVNHAIVSGLNEISFVPDANTTLVSFYLNGTSLFDINIVSVSVKEVAINTVAIPYFAQATKQWAQTTSFTYATNAAGEICHKHKSSFGDAAVLNIALSSEDLTALDGDPDLMRKVWEEGATLPSGITAADIYGFYPGNEGSQARHGGQFVQDITVPKVDITTSFRTLYPNGATTVISSTADSFDLEVTAAASSQCDIQFNLVSASLAQNEKALITFKVVIVSGSTAINYVYINETKSLSPVISANGTYGVVCNKDGATAAIVLGFGVANSTTFRVQVTNIRIAKVYAAEIENYTTDCRTNLLNVNYGPSNLRYTQDATGRLTGASSGIEAVSDGRSVVIPTRTHTANAEVTVTPKSLPITIYSSSIAGTISADASGNVTASSGSVSVDTTTLSVGVESVVTVTGISINGTTSLFPSSDATWQPLQETIV